MPPDGKVQSAAMLGPGCTRDFFRPFAWTCWPVTVTTCEMLQRSSSIEFIHIFTHPSTRSSSPFMYAPIHPSVHAWKWCQLMGKRDRAGTGVHPWFPRAVRVDPLGYATKNLLKGRAARRSEARAMADNKLRNAARCLDVAGAQLLFITLPGRWGIYFSGFCALDFYHFCRILSQFFRRSLRRTTDIQSPSVFAVFVDYTSLEMELHVYRWRFSFAFPITDSEYLHLPLYRFSDRPTGVVVCRLGATDVWALFELRWSQMGETKFRCVHEKSSWTLYLSVENCFTRASHSNPLFCVIFCFSSFSFFQVALRIILNLAVGERSVLERDYEGA